MNIILIFSGVLLFFLVITYFIKVLKNKYSGKDTEPDNIGGAVGSNTGYYSDYQSHDCNGDFGDGGCDGGD